MQVEKVVCILNFRVCFCGFEFLVNTRHLLMNGDEVETEGNNSLAV